MSTSAELLDMAISLGADDPTRLIQSARDHFHVDEPSRARELLDRAIAELGPGHVRSQALSLLGEVVSVTEDFGQAVDLLERALEEAGSDPHLRASIAIELSFVVNNVGRFDDGAAYAAMAVPDAERTGDDGLLAEALGLSVMGRFLIGQGVDEAGLARAVSLEDPERASHAVTWPSLNAAMIHLWTHQLDRARAELAALERRCLERGLESDLWFVLGHSTTAALSCGDVTEAERLVADMAERAGMAGSEPVTAVALTARAILDAWTGRVDQGRAEAQQALAGLAQSRFAGASVFALSALGMAELSVGGHAAAAECLTPAVGQTVAMGLAEPALMSFLPDAVEALIALGRLDEARPIVDRLQARGTRPHGAWAEAVGARGRGLLLAAEGRLEESLTAFERALAAHERLPLPYEKARTLLALGRLRRRRNERRAGKAALEEAIGLFERVGAGQWAANARAELAGLGLRPGSPDVLTPTEERVARLAATGMTNREVAAELLVSPKTVEANLARVYRKLGIGSRAELGRHMAQRHPGTGHPQP